MQPQATAAASVNPAERRGPWRHGRARPKAPGLNPRLVDWLWTIRGTVPLIPAQSSEEAFDRLDPLFHESGTTYERTGDTLTFRKKDPVAQDKMSIFDGGVLQVRQDGAGATLRYRLTSRTLLFCLLLPLLFLGFAQLTIAVGQYDPPTAEEKARAEAEAKKKNDKLPQHWIDKALGSPAPEKPKADKDKKKEDDDKPSPKPAYVFAGLFAALYVAGRILEDRLIRRLFRKKLLGA